MPNVNYNGKVIAFPDGTSLDEMNSALAGLGKPASAPQELAVAPVPPPPEPAHSDPALVAARRATVLAAPARLIPATGSRPAYFGPTGQAAYDEAVEAGKSQWAAYNAQHATAHKPDPQAQTAQLADALSKSKTLRDFAAQSSEHAAAVQPEADKLSWWTRWISGVEHNEPNQAAPWANAGIDYPVEQQRVTDVPSAVSSNFARGLLGLRADFEGLKQFMLERMADPNHLGPALGLPPEHPDVQARAAENKVALEAQKQATKEASDIASAPPTPLEEQSAQFPQKVVQMATGMLPLLAAGPFGEAGAFAAMTSQTVGSLTRQGVSPDRAAAFGLAAGYAGTLLGANLASSLAPLSRVAGARKLLATEVEALSVKSLALDASRHVALGWVANTGILLSDKMALRLQDAADKGRSVDPSEFTQDVSSAAKESTELLPMLGGFAAMGIAGKLWEAHGNALHHDAITTPIKDSKLDPEALKELARNASRNGRVYIDPDHFEKIIRAAGQDPNDVAGKLNGDQGADFRNSKKTGVLMDVPLENYLVDLKEHHEAMREGVAFQDDGATLSRNNGKWVEKELAEELYNKLPNTGEGNAALAHQLTPDQQNIVNAWGSTPAEQSRTRSDRPVPATQPATPAEVARDVRGPSDTTQKVRAPAAKALALHADEVVKDLTVDALSGRTSYLAQARQAQRAIDKAHIKAANLLSRAEETAQQGIDTALEGVALGNRGVKEGPKAVEAQKKAGDARVKAEFERSVVYTKLQQLRLKLKTFDSEESTGTKAGLRKQIKNERERLASLAPGAQPEGGVQEGLYDVGGMQPTKADPQPTPEADARDLAKIRAQDAQIHLRLAQRMKAAAERKYEGAQDKSVRATEHTVAAGEFMQEADAQRFTRDLNLAVEKAKQEALDRAEKLQGKLDDASQDSVREKVYAEGAPREYGAAHDGILEAMGLRAPDGTPRLTADNFVASLTARGEKLEFDGSAIADLIKNGKRKPGELKLGELNNVTRALAQLKHMATEANTTLVDGRRVEREAAIANDIAPTAARGKPQPKGYWRQALRDLLQSDRRDATSSNFHTLLNQLGDWGRSQATRWLGVRRAEDVQLNKLQKLFDKHKGLNELGKTDVEFPSWMPDNARAVYGNGLKQMDVWRAIMQSGTEEGIGALARGWNASPEQIHQWFNDVVKTEPEWNLVKDYWAQTQEFGDLEAAADSNRGGTPMVRKIPRTISTPFGEVQGGYAPVKWHTKGRALPAQPELGDAAHGANAMTDVAHGFTITQQPDVTDVPDISMAKLPAQMRGIVRDISRGDFVRDQARMLNDQGFKQVTGSAYGQDYLNALDAWHNTVATGLLQNVTPEIYRDTLLSKARGVSARIVFNMNTKVVFGLASHFPFAKAALGGDLDLMAGIGKALDSDARNFALQNSQVLPYRNDRVYQKLNEAEAAILRDNPSRLEAAFRRPNQMLWHGADMGLSQVIWHGVHESALRRGYLPGDAVKYADQMTDRLMPSIDIYGKALRTTDNSIGMLFLVKNFESTVWNIKAMKEFDARASETNNGRAPNVFAWKLGMAGALGLGHFLFYGHGRNQEEQAMGAKGWAPYVAREGLEAASYGNLFTHMAAQNFGVLLDGRLPNRRDITLFDTPEHGQISQFVSDVGKVVHAAEGRGQASSAVFAGLRAASRLLGGPTSLLRSAEGAYKVGQYRLLGSNQFVSPPPTTPVGEFGKIFYGDVDKWESNIASEFDNIWRH